MKEKDEENLDRGPWIIVKISLPTSYKTMKLKKALDTPERESSKHEAMGLMVDLWIQTFVNAWSTGDLTNWEPEHLEDMLGWRGEPGILIKAFKMIGLLGADGLVVHDWLRIQRPAIRNRMRHFEPKANGGRPVPVDDSDHVRARTKRALAERESMEKPV